MSCFSNNQAIVTAHNDKNYLAFEKNTKAVLFLGTPHHGADSSKLLSDVLKVTWKKSKFVDQLSTHGDWLNQLNELFRDRGAERMIISCFESKPMFGVSAAFTF